MTRRPFIVVCPETGWADIRTHKGEVDGSYFLSTTNNDWKKYTPSIHRSLCSFRSVPHAEEALASAPPVPADAVWGPGTETQDDPKPTTPGAYSDGYRAGLAQSAAIIDSLRARVRELEAKENANV